MTRLLKLSMLVAVLVAPVVAVAAPAPPNTRWLPISKVWPRSAPNERYLAPPVLLKPGANLGVVPTGLSGKVNINRCSLEQLQNLPGVGPSMGAHLMAGRPFSNVGDLARDGVPLNTIEQITPLIEFGP